MLTQTRLQILSSKTLAHLLSHCCIVPQVEPVAVACMIRIFLRYIVEVEGLTTKGFTKQQNNCYIKTLEVRLCICGDEMHVVCLCAG
jgi:hypothetical protein